MDFEATAARFREIRDSDQATALYAKQSEYLKRRVPSLTAREAEQIAISLTVDAVLEGLRWYFSAADLYPDPAVLMD